MTCVITKTKTRSKKSSIEETPEGFRTRKRSWSAVVTHSCRGYHLRSAIDPERTFAPSQFELFSRVSMTELSGRPTADTSSQLWSARYQLLLLLDFVHLVASQDPVALASRFLPHPD